MDGKELKRLFAERDSVIQNLNAQLESSINNAQRELFLKFFQDFGDKLQFDDKGVILNNAANRLLLQKIDVMFADWAKENNTQILNSLLYGVQGVLDFNKRYYSNFAGDAQLLPLRKKVVENMQGWLGIEGSGKAKENGYLSTLVSNGDVKNKLKDFAMRSIYGQQGYQVTKANLAQLIQGDKENLGALQKYYRNFTYDLYSQIDRATAETYANDLNFVFAIYEGGLIETSREFCKEHNGNVYHKTEIADFDPKVAKQPNYNPFTDLGGYGCRHHLNWIPNALALAMRPDAKKFLTGVGIAETQKQETAKKIAEKPAAKPKPEKPAKIDFSSDINADKMKALEARGFNIHPQERDASYFNKNLKGFDIAAVDDFLSDSFKKFGATSVRKDLRYLDNGFSFRYEVNTPHGAISISRGFFDKDGKNAVYHALLDLPKQLQGNGFTKEFFKELVTQYEAAGIERIEVTANSDVGGYAWGRYGFNAKSKYAISDIINKAKRSLDVTELKELNEWADRCRDSGVWNMRELTNYKWAKNLMLGTQWGGYLDLTNPIQKQIFTDYLNGKK